MAATSHVTCNVLLGRTGLLLLRMIGDRKAVNLPVPWRSISAALKSIGFLLSNILKL